MNTDANIKIKLIKKLSLLKDDGPNSLCADKSLTQKCDFLRALKSHYYFTVTKIQWHIAYYTIYNCSTSSTHNLYYSARSCWHYNLIC